MGVATVLSQPPPAAHASEIADPLGRGSTEVQAGATPNPSPPSEITAPPPETTTSHPETTTPHSETATPHSETATPHSETTTAKTVSPHRRRDRDTTPPILRLPPGIDVAATDVVGMIVTFTVAATDDVDPAPAVSCDPRSGTLFALGTTTVTCTATDAAGNVSDQGSFDVAVRPPPGAPPAPTAEDDFVATVQGAAVDILFLANDVNPDGGVGRSVTVRITGAPSSGKVQLQREQFIYSPKPAFVGTDRFTYALCQDGRCDPATVTIEVREREGEATTALTDPVWQAVAQRPTETLSGTCESALAWGGFANGRIPAEAMTPIGGPHRLERQAAAAFLQMRVAARGDGLNVSLTDSYRSYDAQVQLRLSKGDLVATATPGTSVHGWGKAIDIDLRNPALRSWLQRNAVRFGWVNPAWAKRAGKSFEPWHYEFYGSRPGSGSGECSRPVLGPGTVTIADHITGGGPGSAPSGDATREPAPEQVKPSLFTPIALSARSPVAKVWLGVGVGVLWTVIMVGVFSLSMLCRQRRQRPPAGTRR
jgi:hypothetical protein